MSLIASFAGVSHARDDDDVGDDDDADPRPQRCFRHQ